MEELLTEKVKCLIIGSGPAGYTAAIYASRADLNPVLYTGLEVGGQLTTTTVVDNFPGYPDGVDGKEMMEDLKKQSERFGTDVRVGMVTSVEFNDVVYGSHKITIDNGHLIEAESVIISTGATAKYLGLPSEKEFNGRGVSACAICDGFFYKNQDVVVVGGGDTAVEEAIYLSNICSNVTMLVRKDYMKSSKVMQNKLSNIDNISVMYNTELEEILGDDMGVTNVLIKSNLDDVVSKIDVTGVFIAIGHKPNTDIFLDYLNIDSDGYIITDGNSTETNTPGVFASGDVQDKKYRQAVTSAATGCMAALDAERYLSL